MSNLFNQLISEIDNEYAGIVDDGVAAVMCLALLALARMP